MGALAAQRAAFAEESEEASARLRQTVAGLAAAVRDEAAAQAGGGTTRACVGGM